MSDTGNITSYCWLVAVLQIFVFFPLPEPSKQTIGIGPLRKCIERMQSEKVFNAILVVQHNLTPAAKKATQIPNLRLEIFLVSDIISMAFV